jgi:hypothetical protein
MCKCNCENILKVFGVLFCLASLVVTIGLIIWIPKISDSNVITFEILTSEKINAKNVSIAIVIITYAILIYAMVAYTCSVNKITLIIVILKLKI